MESNRRNSSQLHGFFETLLDVQQFLSRLAIAREWFQFDRARRMNEGGCDEADPAHALLSFRMPAGPGIRRRDHHQPPDLVRMLDRRADRSGAAERLPTRSAFGILRWSSSAAISSPIVAKLIGLSVSAVRPWPCISTAITRRVFASGCTHTAISPIVVSPPWISTRGSPWP